MALDKKYTIQLLDNTYREIMDSISADEKESCLDDINEILTAIDDVQYKIEILGEDEDEE
jgi:hypothetical protein